MIIELMVLQIIKSQDYVCTFRNQSLLGIEAFKVQDTRKAPGHMAEPPFWQWSSRPCILSSEILVWRGCSYLSKPKYNKY